ncbi:MAG: 3-oxoadipate CoA-transferase, partial [Proteobacteria bacterium]|nr:3-oxoadipate CoA-transferase [Pseudomonadota bacterium]
VIEITPRGFEVIEMIPGLTRQELQNRTEAELIYR